VKGYVHIYTGNGKGKTTAAFGLALRACGAGLNVFIGQFIKGQVYNELLAISKYIKNVTIKQFGIGCFLISAPTQEDIDAAIQGFEEMRKIIMEGKFDLVIMDEINIALYYNLVEIEDILDLIENKPEHVELVLTGRYAPQELIDKADLVTEMIAIKHYYSKGIEARKGIEY
jgi:cob(I)alamin adenosyltransferase